MQVSKNVPLSAYSTMRLGGPAAFVAEVTTGEEVQQAYNYAKEQNLPVIMVGGGSNIVWKEEGFAGVVLVNKIAGFENYNEDNVNIYLTVGAGEPWDSVVARAVQNGWSGIEKLSLIPGSTGATPVQNVGAYGQEISEVLVSVEVYDSQTNQLVVLPKTDCGFAYRTSRFKTTDKGRFFITSITLHLTKSNPEPPFYDSLKLYLETQKITTFTPGTIRDAVVAIRNSKLPDPSKVANCGSFFTNPIVSHAQLIAIQDKYPGIVYWSRPDGQVKLSAGWMLEQAGFKGYHDTETGMATWDKQSLIFVNESAKSTADLLKFRDKIVAKINQEFGITLTQEPELLP